jgi:hypothetical protein
MTGVVLRFESIALESNRRRIPPLLRSAFSSPTASLSTFSFSFSFPFPLRKRELTGDGSLLFSGASLCDANADLDLPPVVAVRMELRMILVKEVPTCCCGEE